MRKFKNRSLQNFETWQFTFLSLRKQQRNGLNGTVKSLNCFLTWEEVKLCCFLLTRQVYSRKGLLCRSSHEVLTKMAIRFLEVRRRLHVAFFLLFTWNVEFLQIVALKFVCHKWILRSLFLPKKKSQPKDFVDF